MLVDMNQSTTMTAKVDHEGRLLVPAEVLEAAGVRGCTEFAVEIDEESRSLTLTAVTPEDDDSWAHAPDIRAAIDEGLRDSAEGRVYKMSRSDLEQFVATNQ